MAAEGTVRAILAIAIPSAVFTLLTNSYRIVNQYFIQDVSVSAQAAIGSSVFVLILLYASFEVIAAGAGPLIARATGAGDTEGRRALFGEALLGSAILTVSLMFVGIVGAPTIAHTLGLEGETATECVRYLRTLLWTLAPLVLTPLIDQTFVSMGNARLPLLLHAVSLGLNIMLTPLLIHGAGLGIVGAALASNIAHAVAATIGIVQLKRAMGLRWQDVKLRGQLQRIVRIGMPMALGTAVFAAVYWGLLKTTVSPLGPHVNAALGIGFSALEGFTWPVFHGVSLGVASLVGRHLGAGRPDLAKRTIASALPVSTLLGISATAVFFFAGGRLSGMFTNDAAVHHEATQYALILSASQLVLAWEALTEGALAGAGATRTVFWCSVPFNLLRIPLAWLFAFPLGLGATGVWWAINLTTYAKTGFKAWAVWRGKWTDIAL